MKAYIAIFKTGDIGSYTFSSEKLGYDTAVKEGYADGIDHWHCIETTVQTVVKVK